jgi:hypothetical protein
VPSCVLFFGRRVHIYCSRHTPLMFLRFGPRYAGLPALRFRGAPYYNVASFFELITNAKTYALSTSTRFYFPRRLCRTPLNLERRHLSCLFLLPVPLALLARPRRPPTADCLFSEKTQRSTINIMIAHQALAFLVKQLASQSRWTCLSRAPCGAVVMRLCIGICFASIFDVQ